MWSSDKENVAMMDANQRQHGSDRQQRRLEDQKRSGRGQRQAGVLHGVALAETHRLHPSTSFHNNNNFAHNKEKPFSAKTTKPSSSLRRVFGSLSIDTASVAVPSSKTVSTVAPMVQGDLESPNNNLLITPTNLTVTTPSTPGFMTTTTPRPPKSGHTRTPFHSPVNFAIRSVGHGRPPFLSPNASATNATTNSNRLFPFGLTAAGTTTRAASRGVGRQIGGRVRNSSPLRVKKNPPGKKGKKKVGKDDKASTKEARRVGYDGTDSGSSPQLLQLALSSHQRQTKHVNAAMMPSNVNDDCDKMTHDSLIEGTRELDNPVADQLLSMITIDDEDGRGGDEAAMSMVVVDANEENRPPSPQNVFRPIIP